MHPLLYRIVSWAEGQPPIRAMVLSGSHAHSAGSADELSDLDIALYTSDLALYTDSDGWIREIDNVWVYLPLHTDDGYTTRLVIYEGGHKVDFTLLPLTVLEEEVKQRHLSDIFIRGYRVLLDKDGLAAELPPPTYRPPAYAKPSEKEFIALIEEFWFEAYHIAKYIVREDLWVLKFRDWTTKELLLKMIAWRERSRHGWEYDAWHLGVKMKGWVEPEILARLHKTFARFDREDSRQALETTISLFRELAVQTAKNLGYKYPANVDTNLSTYIRSLIAGVRKMSKDLRS